MTCGAPFLSTRCEYKVRHPVAGAFLRLAATVNLAEGLSGGPESDHAQLTGSIR